MTSFNWKLAILRWVYGALVPIVPSMAVGATTGKVDFRIVGIAMLSGMVTAAVVDIDAYLKSQPKEP